MIASCRPIIDTEESNDTLIVPPRVSESKSPAPWIIIAITASTKAPVRIRSAYADSWRNRLPAKPAAATRYRNGSVI